MRRRPAWLPLATDVNCSYTKPPRAVQSRVPKAGLRSALSRRMTQNVVWPLFAISSMTRGSTVLVEWLGEPAEAAAGNSKRTVTSAAHNAYVERTLIPSPSPAQPYRKTSLKRSYGSTRRDVRPGGALG